MSSDISIVNATPAPTGVAGGTSAPQQPIDGEPSFASVLDGHLERDPAAPLLLARVPGESGPSQFTDTDLVGSFPAHMSVRARYLSDPGLTRIEVGDLALSNDDFTDTEWLFPEPGVALQTAPQVLIVEATEQSITPLQTAADTVNAGTLMPLLPQAEATRQASQQTLNLTGSSTAHQIPSSGAQTAAAALGGSSLNTSIMPGVVEETSGFMAADEPLMMSNAFKGTAVSIEQENQLLAEITVPAQQTRAELSSSLGAAGIAAASPNGPSAVSSGLTTATGGPHAFILNESLGSDAWQDELSNRVTWLNGQTIKRAVIQLRPADLGPISVEVSVKDDKASVNFMAQHALTREALEAALPRLREMFADNGLDLARAAVTDGGGLAQDSGTPDRSGHDSGPQTVLTNTGEDTLSDAQSSGLVTSLSDSQPSRTGLFDAFV